MKFSPMPGFGRMRTQPDLLLTRSGPPGPDGVTWRYSRPSSNNTLYAPVHVFSHEAPYSELYPHEAMHRPNCVLRRPVPTVDTQRIPRGKAGVPG